MQEEIKFNENIDYTLKANIDNYTEAAHMLYESLRRYFEDVLSTFDEHIEAVKKYKVLPEENIIRTIIDKYNSIDVVNYIHDASEEVRKNRTFSIEEKLSALKQLEDLNITFPFIQTLFDDDKMTNFIMEIQNDSDICS